MKRLVFDAEHEQFRDNVVRFMQAEVGPHVERFHQQGMVDRELFRKAGEQGLLCTWADPKFGGAGIDDFRFEQIIIEENMRHGDIGFYINLHSDLVAPYIAKLGTEEQQARWMPGIVSGEQILAVAMTEPAAGSDLAGVRTRVEDKGDHWLSTASRPIFQTASCPISSSSPRAPMRAVAMAWGCSWSSAACKASSAAADSTKWA